MRTTTRSGFERITTVGPDVREAVNPRDDLELSAEARYEWFRFNVDVDYPPDSGESDTRVFGQWSPAGGLRWTWLHDGPADPRAVAIRGDRHRVPDADDDRARQPERSRLQRQYTAPDVDHL